MALVCYLCLCKISDTYSCPRRTSWFLESVATTQTTMMPAYNTQQIMKFLAISAHLVLCLIPWESTTPVYLVIYGCFRQWFLLATCILASITSSEWRGQDSVSTHVQLSHVYLAFTLDVTHVIKCTRLSPSLISGESLGMRLGWRWVNH